ncbi:MAG: hypothetical protein JWO36_7010 [Myxococcales bacterium]|nr:hypothetical protein [Myxococcales bacterium]
MPCRTNEAGFTLTEMMVVVAIMSILSTLAIVYLKPKTKPLDVANRFADLVREGSREAVAYGTVRSNVATNLASKRRTRIRGAGAVGSSPTFTLERLVEDSPATANTGTWVVMQTYQVPSQVVGDSYAGTVGAYASVTKTTTWTTFTISCYPNGSCDAASLFFKSASAASGTPDYSARVSVLPLGTATYIRNDWL